MSHKPNDPCPCGSGHPYKFCHQTVNETPIDRRLSVAHSEYADRWINNAVHYSDSGVYERLSDSLLSAVRPLRIMDIGCGTGQGLAALGRKTSATSDALSFAKCCISCDQLPKCHRARSGYDWKHVRHERNRRYSQHNIPKSVGLGRKQLRHGGPRIMTTTALSFVEADLLGHVASVDTGRVVVSVSNSTMLTRIGIGGLLAIRGATEREYLIALTEKVTRALREELPEVTGEVGDLELVSVPTDTLS